MCGIAGFSGSFSEELLTRMNKVQFHRGPDQGGCYYSASANIGLAHRRLSIIDLSDLGKQPMWDATQKVVIIFNGEIYNYPELRVSLSQLGYQFLSHSDTEVLLTMYLHYGETMLEHLNGVFAFAIFDARHKSLFVARDQLGVKPFYYSTTPKGFIFASELKSLLCEETVKTDLNPQAIHYHLRYIWCPAPNTMLANVHKLLPGHAMVIQEGKIKKTWQYYDLPYNNPINDNLSLSEAKEQLNHHLETAVKRQLIADVPVGAFLSGGLDSSSIVSYVKHLMPNNDLQCFTMRFKDNSINSEGTVDDLYYAQQVAQHLNVGLNIIDVDSSMIEQLPFMLYHLDEPQADPAALNTYFIARLAKEQGIKVLLSGAGGDDFLGGYRRHFALQQEKFWSWVPLLLRRGIKNSAGFLPTKNHLMRRVRKALSYIDLPENERIASYFYWLSSANESALYSPQFQQNLLQNNIDPLMQSLAMLSDKTSKLNKMLYLEGKYFLVDHNLNYTDKMTMATGVEARVPLIDPDLVDFATRLPLNYKQNGSVGKWLFKQTMEKYLPKSVIYRPKAGFGGPVRYWITHQLNGWVEEVLSARNLQQRGFFDAKAVANLIQANKL